MFSKEIQKQIHRVNDFFSKGGGFMRIAIFTLGSRGDVQPYVALAKEAINKGHSAIICTGKTFKNLIVENGIEFAEAESDLMAMLETEEGREILNNPTKHILKIKKYVKEVIGPAYRKTLDQFWEIAQNADVIIYHPKAFGVADMSLELGIPCISMPPVPITYPIEEFPNLAISPTKNLGKTLNKFTYKLMAKGELSNLKELNDFREKVLKLKKRKAGIYAYKINDWDIPIIYPISNALFPNVQSWKDKVYLPGFFYLDLENQKLEDTVLDFINKGSAPIVISFSSMPLKNPDDFKNKLVEALKKTNNRAIVLTGISGMTFENHENILAIKQAPHTLLFPLAKGIVHHGGVGTMATALRSGRPQLIIPFAVDQPFWAHRLHTMGYALKPIYEKSLETNDLLLSFREMEDEKYIKAAVKIKEIIMKENGTENAIKYIETICEKWK